MTNLAAVPEPIDPEKIAALTRRQLPRAIANDQEYVIVCETLKETDAELRHVASVHDPVIASAHQTHRIALDAKAKVFSPLSNLKRICTALIGEYDRKKRDQARQLEAEARRAMQKRLDEQKLADALEAENAGDSRLAEEIINEPTPPPLVKVEDIAPKVAGVGVRDYWSAEVVNKRRYVCHVLGVEYTEAEPANWKLLESTIDIQLQQMNNAARMVKKEIELFPGVVARCETRGSMTGGRGSGGA